MGFFNSKILPKWRIDVKNDTVANIDKKANVDKKFWYKVLRKREFTYHEHDEQYEVMFVADNLDDAKRYVRFHFDFPLEYFNKPEAGQ
jgi:hypothetical protein